MTTSTFMWLDRQASRLDLLARKEDMEAAQVAHSTENVEMRGSTAGRCPICVKPRSDRYVNEAAGEACIHPCHWPYLSAEDVARASIALDRVKYVNGAALRSVWA